MRMPAALRNLDDKFLGDRLRRRAEPVDVRATENDDPREQRRQGRDVADTEAETVNETPRGTSTDGLHDFLAILYRVVGLVFMLLAALLVLAIVFTYATTNKDNTIVSHVLDYADNVAGPFKDIFTVKDNDNREVLYNYGLAAVVYFGLSLLVQRLPLPGRTKVAG